MSAEQKVVYAALKRLFDDRTAIQGAFHHWQQVFSNQAIDVVEVTAELVKFLGLNSQEKKVLMIGLHAAANRSTSELEDVPPYILAANSAIPVAATVPEESRKEEKKSVPHLAITSEFIKAISAAVRRSDASVFREIDEMLRDQGLSEADQRSNAKAKRYGFDARMLSSKLDADTCCDLTHALYMVLIDFIGPVKADVIVNDVIDGLLQNDAASRFDPRSLI